MAFPVRINADRDQLCPRVHRFGLVHLLKAGIHDQVSELGVVRVFLVHWIYRPRRKMKRVRTSF